jgi:uncharacterized protein YkwD
VGPKITTACVVLAALACAALAPSAGAMDLGRLIAPQSVCPNQDRLEAPAAVQEQAMRCMTDFARQRRGMAGLADAANLNRSALDKGRDIMRCDDFSHTACGRNFSYWMQRVGYIPARCWRVGENLAWGSGELGTVRAIFRALIYSPEHRANILGRYTQIGTALAVGSLEGHQGAHLWIQHFGSHCTGPLRLTRHRTPRLARAVVAPAG